MKKIINKLITFFYVLKERFKDFRKYRVILHELKKRFLIQSLFYDNGVLIKKLDTQQKKQIIKKVNKISNDILRFSKKIKKEQEEKRNRLFSFKHEEFINKMEKIFKEEYQNEFANEKKELELENRIKWNKWVSEFHKNKK